MSGRTSFARVAGNECIPFRGHSDREARIGQCELTYFLVAVRLLADRLANQHGFGHSVEIHCVHHGGGKRSSADHHKQAATAVDPRSLLDGFDQQATPLLIVTPSVVPKIDDQACGPQAIDFPNRLSATKVHIQRLLIDPVHGPKLFHAALLPERSLGLRPNPVDIGDCSRLKLHGARLSAACHRPFSSSSFRGRSLFAEVLRGEIATRGQRHG